ncbi:hypothetical protein DAMA08_010950 [Martiniozyma asiatica (nom. inval.)]|nr:hypothetical protein DAMA08_010950 [Martiniozyma asiatica]
MPSWDAFVLRISIGENKYHEIPACYITLNFFVLLAKVQWYLYFNAKLNKDNVRSAVRLPLTGYLVIFCFSKD